MFIAHFDAKQNLKYDFNVDAIIKNTKMSLFEIAVWFLWDHLDEVLFLFAYIFFFYACYSDSYSSSSESMSLSLSFSEFKSFSQSTSSPSTSEFPY